LPVITYFSAIGGLYYAIENLGQEKDAGWHTVWEGFKKYGWLSLRLGLIILMVDALFGSMIWFFFSIDQSWGAYAGSAAILALIIWLAMVQFSFPLLFIQQKKSVHVAIRNGYVILLRQPLAAIKLLSLTAFIAIISTLIPPLWIIISMALIARLREKTTQSAVSRIREADAKRDAIQTHREGNLSSAKDNIQENEEK
jgi:uncharacterized membrane protein YesL